MKKVKVPVEAVELLIKFYSYKLKRINKPIRVIAFSSVENQDQMITHNNFKK